MCGGVSFALLSSPEVYFATSFNININIKESQFKLHRIFKMISKRKEKKQNKALALKAAKQIFDSVDCQVQHTNDDSVVSKRSAVAHGYTEDPYLRLFVKSRVRRSPLINRGYYLRMKVITDLVLQSIDTFASTHPESPIQVISLGAGYDTLAFRSLLSNRTENAFFYDVDFPAVMKSKSLLMKGAPSGTFPDDWKINSDAPRVFVHSPSYAAVGVDLREAVTDLVSGLVEANSSFSLCYPTIFYAECVTQYMPAAASCSLLSHLSQTFQNAVFFAYDQIHPQDSFGGVMEHSLSIRKSPLLGIRDFGTGEALAKRALSCGMVKASFADFHRLSKHYLSEEEMKRMAALELFDEEEEWSEMCEHYAITLCQTSLTFPADFHPSFRAVELQTLPAVAVPANASPITCTSVDWPSGRFRFERWGNGDVVSQTLLDGDRVFISFGGFSSGKEHGRLQSVYCYSSFRGDLDVVVASDCVPPAMMFHSFSKIADSTFVVFGGRGKPSDAFSEAYLLTLVGLEEASRVTVAAHWDKLSVTSADSPPARYRHAATMCGSNLFIYGGRDGQQMPLNDAWVGAVSVASKEVRWSALKLTGDVPSPRCSAASVCVSGCVYLSGGLETNHEASSDIIKVNVSSGECTKVPVDIGKRFSHSMTLVRYEEEDYLMIAGGSVCNAKSSCHFALLVNLLSYTVVPVEFPDGSAPFWWSRHSCICLEDGVVVVIGGGYVCFSFGMASPRPCVLQLGASKLSISLCRSEAPLSMTGSNLLQSPLPVEEGTLTREGFLQLAHAASKPVVFRNVDLGTCVAKWKDPQYLSESEKDMMVSVHVAKGSTELDFIQKNFSFKHLPFQDLVGHVVESTEQYRQTKALSREILYFRSISSRMKTDKANVWKDFPHIGADFQLPEEVRDYIMPRLHQCCWRMNAIPLTLWMHYDTSDNVLCQIVGRKKVTLIPPNQYNNLYMCDSSSPVLSMSHPDLLRFPKFIEAKKHAIEVVLAPGDMMFIPALWFHHLETLEESEDSYSVSVNAFFEHFEPSAYDKKDLYGNKDLPYYAKLRADIVESVTNMVQECEAASPHHNDAQYIQFALREAIQDLEALAENLDARS